MRVRGIEVASYVGCVVSALSADSHALDETSGTIKGTPYLPCRKFRVGSLVERNRPFIVVSNEDRTGKR